ncbi:MAG: hypothetical protein V1810_00495 [Candidatus Beckwithbacteria bacterium]
MTLELAARPKLAFLDNYLAFRGEKIADNETVAQILAIGAKYSIIQPLTGEVEVMAKKVQNKYGQKIPYGKGVGTVHRLINSQGQVNDCMYPAAIFMAAAQLSGLEVLANFSPNGTHPLIHILSKNNRGFGSMRTVSYDVDGVFIKNEPDTVWYLLIKRNNSFTDLKEMMIYGDIVKMIYLISHDYMLDEASSRSMTEELLKLFRKTFPDKKPPNVTVLTLG